MQLKRFAAVVVTLALALLAMAAEPLKIAFVYVGPIGDGCWTHAYDVGCFLGDKPI